MLSNVERLANQELDKFAKIPELFCMLLGKDGSHDLDLSSVTHVFFLDDSIDKSLESQVVARAYQGCMRRYCLVLV